MSDSELDDQLVSLKSSLDETIALLREHSERHWLSWAEDCQQELVARDTSAFDHILAAYGGMGSFNDLLILGSNGHLIEPDREAAVNNCLGHLRTAIWTSATALRNENRETSRAGTRSCHEPSDDTCR